MPLRIERLRLFGPHPAPGERLACSVHIREQGPRDVVADLWLAGRAGVWAQIEGWQDRRFETDARLWPVMIFPEKNLLAEPRPEGFVVFNDRYRGAATRDQLARRFLGERERADYEAQGPRGQRAWLNGRIAAKDAVRAYLGRPSLYPVEIELWNEPDGRPRVRVAGADLRVSIAHKGDLAVARVAEGREVGIDVERIEPRAPGFAAAAFHDDELALIDGSDEQLTRLWSAKEAAGKQRGSGLQGSPLRLRVTDRAGERLLVEGLWVETRREGEHIIAWTTP
jgi:phosphopantetheinyl transferase